MASHPGEYGRLPLCHSSPAPPVVLPSIIPISESSAATVRDLTLNEDSDSYGRLIQRLGTNIRLSAGTFARNFGDAATERPRAGDSEVWRIFNLTGDTHPIHFHLVNVQILERQPFDAKHYTGSKIPWASSAARFQRNGVEGDCPDEPRRNDESHHELPSSRWGAGQRADQRI
jgi:hypothetical protein